MDAGSSAGEDTGKYKAKVELHGSAIIAAIKASSVQFILSVPDIVTSAGLLRPISRDPDLRLVRVCKEDECIGIASGLHFCDKRAVILIQYTGFLDSLNAHAVTCYSALLDEAVHGGKDFWSVVDIGRKRVELNEVEAIDIQVLARSVDPCAQVLRRVLLEVQGSSPADLRCNHDRFASLFAETCDKPLAASIAVDVGCVKEGHPGVGRGMKGPQALVVVDLSPVGPDRPCAEANLASLASCLAEAPVSHQIF